MFVTVAHESVAVDGVVSKLVYRLSVTRSNCRACQGQLCQGKSRHILHLPWGPQRALAS